MEEKTGSTNKIILAKLSDKADTLANNLDKLAKIVTNGFDEHIKFNKSFMKI